MKFSMVAYGKRTGIHPNLQIVFPILRQLIHIGYNTKPGLYLIWNVLHKFPDILHTDDITCVINTNINDAAMSIGKAANPLQIFIPPRFLIFDILTFSHKLPPKQSKKKRFLRLTFFQKRQRRRQRQQVRGDRSKPQQVRSWQREPVSVLTVMSMRTVSLPVRCFPWWLPRLRLLRQRGSAPAVPVLPIPLR